MAVFKVQAPDGTVIKVEAADEATAIRGAQEHYSSRPQPAPKPATQKVAAPQKQQRNAFGEITGAMANFNRGLGVGDEIAAAGNAAVDVLRGRVKWAPGDFGAAAGAVGNAFDRRMSEQRQNEDAYASDRPNAAALARGTGMTATALVPATKTANAFAQGGRLVNAARGATVAGITGAGYAAADRGTLKERAQGAAEAAHDPVTLALGAAGGVLGPAAKKPARAKPAPAPSLDELTSSKNAAYKAVEQSGEKFAPEAMTGFVDDLGKEMQAANINPARHPRAASMLSDIEKLRGQPMSLTQLDQLRQVIRRDVGNAPDAAEQFMGRKMIEALDGFIDSSPAASGAVKTARGLNTKVRKIETVNEAVDRAKLRAGSTGSGGNVDNATRQELRRVFEKTPNFTPEEQAALERIITGSKGQNLLRQAGKLSPQGNGLMTALSIGGAAANPLLAIPTGIGAISKVVADGMTQKRVKDLVSLIARGSNGKDVAQAQRELADIIAKDPAVAALKGRVQARVSRAVGVAGAASQRNAFAQPANP